MKLLRPKVVTAVGSDFEELTSRLSNLVLNEFDPDVVVAIANGGTFVAQRMLSTLGGGTKIVEIRFQRAATKIKGTDSASRWLRAIPRSLADLLRWSEVEYREARWNLIVRHRPDRSTVTMPDEDVLATLRTAERILVVDDTIDSGVTMTKVRDLVHSVAPRASLRTAAITSTWRRPPVTPDYLLFTRTLIRFSWSYDF